jgi:hypothetical protein
VKNAGLARDSEADRLADLVPSTNHDPSGVFPESELLQIRVSASPAIDNRKLGAHDF